MLSPNCSEMAAELGMSVPICSEKRIATFISCLKWRRGSTLLHFLTVVYPVIYALGWNGLRPIAALKNARKTN